MAKTNYILRAAVATCFGAIAGNASAVLNLSVATPTGINKYAKELPNTTTTLINGANNLDIKVAVPQKYNVNALNPLYVKLNLTNGASFTTNPSSFRCGTAAAANSLSGVMNLGGAGTAYVVYAVETGIVSGTCSATLGNVSVSAGNFGNVAVSATVEYKNGLSNIFSGIASDFVTFVKGVSATVAQADGTVTVDATNAGSTKFTATSNKGALLANVGLVSFNAVGTSAVDAAGATNIAIPAVVTQSTVTVNGASLAAALATNGVSGVFLDAASSACTTRSYQVASTAANSVTFSGISNADIVAGVNVCLNVSGSTTQIGTGQITATLGGTPAAGVTVDFSGLTNLENILANGTTKNAYFVNASTSTAKTSVIRIVNTGGGTGTIRATAYVVGGDGTPDGTQVGTANAIIGTLAANQSISLTSAAIETLLGYTPASGTVKYRVVFSAGLADFIVMNFTRDVVGGVITLSQAQDN